MCDILRSLMVAAWAQPNVHSAAKQAKCFDDLPIRLSGASCMLQSVAQSIAQQLAEKSKDNSRAVDGKSWVRGWDDSWRGASPDAVKASDAGATLSEQGPFGEALK